VLKRSQTLQSQTSDAKYLRGDIGFKKDYKMSNTSKGALPNVARGKGPLTETKGKQSTISTKETKKQGIYTNHYDSNKGGFKYHMNLAWLGLMGSVGCAFNALFPWFSSDYGERKLHQGYKRVWEKRYGHLTGRARPPYPDVEVWRVLRTIDEFLQGDKDELHAD